MRRFWLLAFLFLTACAGPPAPIMGRTSPPIALRPPDSAGIYVLPAENAPTPAAAALADAMATALQRADVPASAHASNVESYRLQPIASLTSAADGRETISIAWELRDAAGKVVGSTPSQAAAVAGAWQRGDDGLATALAAPAAPVIAKLIEGDVPLPQGHLTPVVVLHGVTGAPGDGDRALTRAMGVALERSNLALAAGPTEAEDFIVTGRVEVAAATVGTMQRVRITWALQRPDGREVGQIKQENAVPAGSLNGAWGEVAYAITRAAAPGVRQLIEEARLSTAGPS